MSLFGADICRELFAHSIVALSPEWHVERPRRFLKSKVKIRFPSLLLWISDKYSFFFCYLKSVFHSNNRTTSIYSLWMQPQQQQQRLLRVWTSAKPLTRIVAAFEIHSFHVMMMTMNGWLLFWMDAMLLASGVHNDISNNETVSSNSSTSSKKTFTSSSSRYQNQCGSITRYKSLSIKFTFRSFCGGYLWLSVVNCGRPE